MGLRAISKRSSAIVSGLAWTIGLLLSCHGEADEQREVSPISARGPRAPQQAVPAPTEDAHDRLERETGVRWDRLEPSAPGGALLLRARGKPNVVLTGRQPTAVALSFLASHAAIFGMRNASAELKAAGSGPDPLGLTYAIFEQVERDVPVEGARVSVLFDKEGRLVSVSSNYVAGLDRVSTLPRLTVAEAKDRALADVRAHRDPNAVRVLSEPGARADVIFTPRVGTAVLAYRIEDSYIVPTAGGAGSLELRHLVDAQTGEVVGREDMALY